MRNEAVQLIVKKGLLGMIEMLVPLPIVIYIWTVSIGSGNLYTWLALLFIAFFTGLLMYEWKPNQKIGVYFVLSIVLSLTVAVALMSSVLAMVVTGIFMMAAFLRGLRYGREALGEAFPEFFLLGGFFVYFVAYFFYREIESLALYQTLLMLAGVTIVLFTLFQGNQEYLKAVTLSEERKPYVSKTVRVRNRVAVAILVGVAFLITSAQYVEAFFSRIFAFIGSLLASSPSEEAEPALPPAENMMPDFGFGEEPGEPSRFAELLQTVMMYVVGALVIVGAIVLLVVIFKTFRKHLRRFWNWLLGAMTKLGRSDSEEEELPYVDEKMSIRDWQAWRKKQNERLKDWVTSPFQKEPTVDDFPTRNEKIRFLYRKALDTEMKRGYQFRQDATPSETLQELIDQDRQLAYLSEKELADVYAKVRYGDLDITEEEFNQVFRKDS